jgi:hypothetical protein
MASRKAREECTALLKTALKPNYALTLEDIRFIAAIPEDIQDGMLRVKNKYAIYR